MKIAYDNLGNVFRMFINFLLIAVLFILVCLLTGLGRGYFWGVPIDCYVQLCFFFVITVVVFRKDYRFYKIYYYFMNGLIMLLLFYCFKVLFWDTGNINTLVIPNILCLALGYVAGILWNRNHQYWGSVLLVAGLFVATLYVSRFSYFAQYYTYRTITGKTHEVIGTDSLVMTDRHGDTLQWEPDVYYVMDVWHSSCYTCFQKMPEFNMFYETNRYPNVRYLLVNHPLPRDTGLLAFHIMDEKGLAVPGYTGTAHLSRQLGVVTYPTIVVICNSMVLYRGNPEPFAELDIVAQLAGQ